jgi:hypothetical protein
MTVRFEDGSVRTERKNEILAPYDAALKWMSAAMAALALALVGSRLLG